MGLPSYLDVPPRFGTLRNFDNPTYGTRKALVAQLLGTPFIPWQRYVADVLGEVDPRTGIRVYRHALVTLMRQGGKTTWVITEKTTRAIDCVDPQVIHFAAQDGIEAKKKWLNHAKVIKRSPLGRRLIDGTPTTSNGKEILEWDNGSSEIPLSGAEGSGHGDSVNLGVITEAFAHKDSRYIDTISPAMNRDPNAQLLIESTQGTAESIYLNELTAEYTARELADPAELRAGRIAYFNWSFADDDDIGAESTWRRRMPQLGHLLRLEEVQSAWQNATTPKKVRAFKRGYGNMADLGAGELSVFDEESWERSGTGDALVGARALTIDVTPDRSWASIAWAGLNSSGRQQSELVEHERSTHWLVAKVGEILDRNPRMPRRVYCAPGGQAALMADKFERAGIALIVLSRAEYAAACASYYDGITDEDGATIEHVSEWQTPLDVAVGGAVWTKGEARVWDSLRATTILCPLVAVSIAPWAFQIEQDREADDYDIEDSIA